MLEESDSHLREGRPDPGARGLRGVVCGICVLGFCAGLASPASAQAVDSAGRDHAVVRHCVLEEGIAFLSKPFDLRDLTRTVREVLDSGPIEREAVPGTERSPG